MPARAAFVTIGQSPRTDMLPEILAHSARDFEAVESGALDDLDDAEIAALAPRAGGGTLVTRLRDGREIMVGKQAIEARIAAIVAELDDAGFDLVVLLCTGHFPRFGTRTPLVHAQYVVEHFALALAGNADRIGIILPDPDQLKEVQELGGRAVKAVSASPYAPDHERALRDAGAELGDTDIILLHCMGFTEAMRAIVAEASGRPAFAPRRLIAHAIDLMLS